MKIRTWQTAISAMIFLVCLRAQACGLRDNGATMTDPVTGIEIQKCLMGHSWMDNACTGKNTQFRFDEAVTRYGRGEWRLITKAEADQVVQRSKGCSAISGTIWSSSPFAGNADRAWIVDFVNGIAGDGGKSITYGVRLVRSSQLLGGVAALGSAPSNSIQNQSAQQQAAQAQQLAQQNQARADQARQGKRKTHDPAAEAHECVAIDNAGSGNFGAFKNTCGYRVNFYTCNYKPRITQGGFNWSADFDCEKQKMGMHTPGAGVSVAAHNRNTEMVYWFACKAPATPVDAAFVMGKGIEARCH